MYHNNLKKFIFSFILFFLFTFILFNSISIKSKAMDVTSYSYDSIKSILPEKYRSNEYIYKENGRAYLCFATYNGNRFRTTIKKEENVNHLLYCVNHNNTIIFNKEYTRKNNLFNNELRVRLGIAFYNAPTKWNEKAAKKFTTGNFVLDYYMTQIVVHSLIYRYGGSKSDYGIDFSKVMFKEDTKILEEKTKAFYKYCCNAEVKYSNGNFQSTKFSFKKVKDSYMYLDNECFVSPSVECNVATDNAPIQKYERSLDSKISVLKDKTIIEETSQTYDSSFNIKVPQSTIDELPAGMYSVNVAEEVTFSTKRAGFWKCSESGYEDTNQEVGDLLTENLQLSDNVEFNILVGQLNLYKKDSITKENISDAGFEILQYNSATQQYEFYKKMVYNPIRSRYESGNLYLSRNNKEGKFKVIETNPGINYIMDWEGQNFEVTKDTYIHEMHVENQPDMGKLKIKKTGEQWSFTDNQFKKSNVLPLPGVKYELYAKEDIYVQNEILYAKDTKLADLITDDNGECIVENLPIGEYYIYETKTLDDYILDRNIHYFSITRDDVRKYSEINYTFNNKLKDCQIEIFKYYFDEKDSKQNKKLPLKNAKFGLYLLNDIVDINGTIIVKKDTCLKEAYSDADGKIIFSNLPYVEYYIKELEAPKDFVINDGIVQIKKDDFIYDEEKRTYSCTKDILNSRQEFSIQVKKTADAFTGYVEETTEFGKFYSYQIGAKELQQVTFSLYNMERELVDKQTTDKKGIAKFVDLVPGKYYLVESAAPAEYKLIETGKDIIYSLDSKEYNILSPPIIEQTFYNELCECTIDITKTGEKAIVKNKTIQYEQVALSNVLFGIYQNFDYTCSNNNNILKKGSCVGYIITDKNGKGSYTNKLPCGDYYLKELKTNSGYELDDKEYYFKIQPNNNKAISVQLENQNTFHNLLSKASVQIIKTDANTGKKLNNVEFTLYNDKSEKIGVYKTNRKGKITVENLPYGKYYFVETKSKNGYYSTNNKYYFTLDTDEMITLNITNSPIVELGFEEHYKLGLLITGGIIIVLILIALFEHKKSIFRRKNHE